jgi:hypothetical protein
MELVARLLRRLVGRDGAGVFSTIADYAKLLRDLPLSTTSRDLPHSGEAVRGV